MAENPALSAMIERMPLIAHSYKGFSQNHTSRFLGKSGNFFGFWVAIATGELWDCFPQKSYTSDRMAVGGLFNDLLRR